MHPLRILLVHNYYRSGTPSGENQVFDDEFSMLLRHDNEVEKLVRHSDEISQKGVFGICQSALTNLWNPRAIAALRQKVAVYGPDIIHVHNTFPLLSPGIFRIVGSNSVKVMTLHNYRLYCSSAIPLRKGRPCTACLDSRSIWRSIVYGCYRNSRRATAPLALGIALHRSIGTWTRHVDAFIALSEFQKRLMINAGLPAQRVFVKPNFYSGNPVTIPWDNRGEYAVFAGRLSTEKGIENLVRAWLLWGDKAPELRILGDGPLSSHLKRVSAPFTGKKIQFIGQVPITEVERQIAHSKLLILPSVCFETFGMVVLSAFACGTPAAVSEIGPLPTIVQNGKNGIVFSPGEINSLLKEVRTAWETPGYLDKLGKGAKATAGNHYTEDANYQILMKIYQAAMNNRPR